MPFVYPVRSTVNWIHEGGILVPIYLQQTDRRWFWALPLPHPSLFFCDFSCFSAELLDMAAVCRICFFSPATVRGSQREMQLGFRALSGFASPAVLFTNVSAEDSGKSNNVSDLRKVFSPRSVATMVALGGDPRQWQGR